MTAPLRDLKAADLAFKALVNPIASPPPRMISSASRDDAWDTLMGWDLNSTRQWLQTLPVNTVTKYGLLRHAHYFSFLK